MNLAVVAGLVSTVIFALSMMPMLCKAARTKNMESYSLSNILLTNAGNLVHSVYVFSMPPGPIWVLHSFYLVTTGTMLFWYLRYAKVTGSRTTAQTRRSADMVGIDAIDGLDEVDWLDEVGIGAVAAFHRVAA